MASIILLGFGQLLSVGIHIFSFKVLFPQMVAAVEIINEKEMSVQCH